MSHAENVAIIARNEKIDLLVQEKIELVRQRDGARKVISDFLQAYHMGAVELNSQEIQVGDEAPYPWHEEWLSYARAAVGYD